MPYCIEKSGKTVDEAIRLALEELKVEKNELEIQILDEGNKGLFGIIGNKMAKIKATIKETCSEKAVGFLNKVLEKIDISATFEKEEDEDNVFINVKGDDVGIVIGRHGDTLDSLQYLVSLVANKNTEHHKKVILDIENYRKKKEDALINLANNTAENVVKYKKSITLKPMSSYERKIVHATLQNNKLIETCSVGSEPDRRVMIKLR